MDIRLLDYQLTCAAGLNMQELQGAIREQRSGLRLNDFNDADILTWVGRVAAVDELDLISTLPSLWQSRNNALAELGLQQGSILDNLDDLKSRFSSARIGLVMGSSTASIDRLELAYKHLDQGGHLTPAYQQAQVHNPHSPALYVAQRTGITGPAITINTACSSSAKVFASAARWLELGLVDAVLVGGVDTLCESVLHGFNSLQLLSPNPCRPFDQNRDGINLGEAAGYAILMRADETYLNSEKRDLGVKLSGYGESSDAHHMSHPHPDGLGAKQAIEQALSLANLPTSAIAYINLHGTSSRVNDLIEGQLVNSIFPKSTQCSSTKAWMGHTLGAAGITEALIAIEAARNNLVPGSMNLSQLDNELDLSIQADNLPKELQHVMSNSFGFGGNNCCLIFSKVGVA